MFGLCYDPLHQISGGQNIPDNAGGLAGGHRNDFHIADRRCFVKLCNAVVSGKILTGKSSPAIDPAIPAKAQVRTPWSRLGLPRDIANAVLFFASDEATFIAGKNLMVDGGWMAH